MRNVATPEPVRASMVARLRPTVSPMCPKMAAPMGRPIRVAAKIVPLTMAAVELLISGAMK